MAENQSTIRTSSEKNVRISGVHSAINPIVLDSEDLSGYREIESEYDVGEQIGRGGCAVVIEAWRKTDHMHVVIKVLQVPPGFDEHETHVAIARFMREAKLIASLNEEHIVRCVDYGCFQGVPSMVLEFVNGQALDAHLREFGAMPLELAADITIQVLSALVETHSQKIIHRDIKPGNIMILGEVAPFKVKVLDFGISSVLDGFQTQTLMTQQGSIRGTPSYMAPELFTGETHASIESDLYAVGLVFLECMTAEIAFNDKSCMQVAYKQVNEELEIPSFIPPSIAIVIAKLCEKSAEDRYHSASDVIHDIQTNLPQALAVEEKYKIAWEKEQQKLKAKGGKKKGKSRTLNSKTITLQRWYKRPKFLVLIVFFILLVVALCLLLWQQRQKNEALQRANQSLEPVQMTVVDRDAEMKLEAELEAKNKQLEEVRYRAKLEAALNQSVSGVSVAFGLANDALSELEKKEAAEKKKANTPKKKPKKDSRPRDSKVNNHFFF